MMLFDNLCKRKNILFDVKIYSNLNLIKLPVLPVPA